MTESSLSLGPMNRFKMPNFFYKAGRYFLPNQRRVKVGIGFVVLSFTHPQSQSEVLAYAGKPPLVTSGVKTSHLSMARC